MRILLTGACGYVGSALMPKLIAAGHTVRGIDTQWFRADSAVEMLDVRTILDIGDTELVLHLAAIANDPSVSFYPRRSWETGVLATMQLAEAARAAGARFIFSSSVSVYGAGRGLVKETDALRPLTDYNKTKMCAERILLSYPGIRPQIVRPATICGLSPRMRLDLTVNLFTIQALQHGVITVHGGQQYRPSIHIDDMCALYLWLIDHPERVGIWNAGFENSSLADIAKKVSAATGADIDTTPQRDLRSYQVDSSKLLAAGFVPTKSIDDAIKEISDAWSVGALTNEPRWNNLVWMRQQRIADE